MERQLQLFWFQSCSEGGTVRKESVFWLWESQQIFLSLALSAGGAIESVPGHSAGENLKLLKSYRLPLRPLVGSGKWGFHLLQLFLKESLQGKQKCQSKKDRSIFLLVHFFLTAPKAAVGKDNKALQEMANYKSNKINWKWLLFFFERQ